MPVPGFLGASTAQNNANIVYVKTLTGLTLEIPFNPSDTVLNIKKKIYAADNGFPVDEQRIIFAGKQL